MTLKEWLRLNVNHKAVFRIEPGDRVGVVLKGGHGVDAHWVGKGDGPDDAVTNALETRDKVRATLP